MICKNCNSQIDEGDVFCPECGCKYEEEPAIQEPTQFASRDGFDDRVALESSEEVPLIPAKKKKGAGKSVLIILAVILLLAGAVALFWKPLLFSVAPEKYMSLLVKNTMDEISEETATISKNIFGFELSPQKEFTAGVNYEFLDAYSDRAFDVQLSNYPNKNKAVAKGNLETGSFKTPFEAFWDDKEIGLSLTKVDKDFLTVPSKEFGKGFDDSECVYDIASEDMDDAGLDILSSLDLSYSNIMGKFDKDSKESKSLEKHLSRNLQEFFKKSDIGEREAVTYSFDKGRVKTKKIAISFDTDDYFDFLINFAEDVKDDKKLCESIGQDALKEIISALKDIKKDSDNKDMQFEIIEYKGKIVSVAFENEYDESDYWDNYYKKTKTTISVGDKNNILSSIKITTESEYEYSRDEDEYRDAYGYEGNSLTESSFTSNWITDDEKITISIEVDSENDETNLDGEDSDTSYNESVEFVLDFKKGKWNLDTKDSMKWSDGEKETYEHNYEGKCSKKKGFTFTVDEEWKDESWDYTMGYGEWMANHYQDWLEDIYDEYRLDYLQYVYEEVGSFYYSYDTYYDWYASHGSVWDVPDYDFEEWLFDYEEIFDDDNEAYEEECWKSKSVDAYAKFELTLKPKADVKISDGKHINIFEWDEDDFEDFGQEAMEEMKK